MVKLNHNWSVYKHTAPNGKCYIGITSRKPEYRWNNGKGYKQNNHFYNAIQKYGWDNIKHEILYSGLDEETACALEASLVFILNSNNPKHGYNNCFGGGKGSLGAHWTQTEEHRKKISEALSGRTGIKSSNYGKTYSEEWRKHISESKRGKPSKLRGRTMPEEHKKHISEALAGKPQYQKRKKVMCVSLNKEFDSVNEAGKELSIDSSSIAKCCKGKRKSAGGYIWRYV